MKLEQSFEVDAPTERVWDALVDVERVAPCLPGAAVIARNDDGSFAGEFKVKIGPASAAYHGRLVMEEVDAAGRTARMQASGTDRRGQGAASATIVSTIAATATGATAVTVTSDYTITGRLARFGRGGQIEEIAAELLREFSANLQELLGGAAPPAAKAPAAEPAAVPVPAPEPAPPADPDAVIEGALPVADALADEPATPEPEPAVSSSEPPPAPAAQATFPGYPPPAEDPGTAVSGPIARVRDKALPLGALLVGFLVALRVLRRR